MTDVQKTAVVEEIANDQPAEGSSLRLRIRQQEILAELGVLSLQGTPFPDLVTQTASLVAEGLDAEFCKVLEYQRNEARFLVTAGVGWGTDVIGIATVGADIESPAGYALVTGKPVISIVTRQVVCTGPSAYASARQSRFGDRLGLPRYNKEAPRPRGLLQKGVHPLFMRLAPFGNVG